MRIALLHPTYWPEVRRGSERLVHDLGRELSERGHEVTLLTSHRARRSVTFEDGIRVIRNRRLPQPPMLGLHERFLGNAHNVARELISGCYELAHAMYPTDAWVAVQMRRAGGPPVIFSLHGVPQRRYLVNRRYRLEMIRTTIAKAAACTVLSHAAAEAFRRFLLHQPLVLGGGVRMQDFAVSAGRAPEPTLVCASSLTDPRKRAPLVVAAFQRLRERRPDLRLRVVRTPDPEFGSRPIELPEGAEWVDAGTTIELAHVYAQGWATVLAAPDEAFGLVLLESLAAGTPVVAPRSGGCPEIVSSARIGKLFEADDEEALAESMDAALNLAEDAEVAERCREHAARWDWSRAVRAYEELYVRTLVRQEGTDAPGKP